MSWRWKCLIAPPTWPGLLATTSEPITSSATTTGIRRRLNTRWRIVGCSGLLRRGPAIGPRPLVATVPRSTGSDFTRAV